MTIVASNAPHAGVGEPGALMVGRSALIDVRPFRTGLVVTSFGLLAALGSSHGGAIGSGLQDLFGLLVGATGTSFPDLVIGDDETPVSPLDWLRAGFDASKVADLAAEL